MKKGQIYGIVTYDALFKWVLDAESIRPSFFHAFIPGIVVQSSERLDDHMNPWQELQLLRNMINEPATTTLVTSLKEGPSRVEVHIDDSCHEKATQFLKDILHHFDDIQYSFPKLHLNGTMDFVCRLDTGEYALIEMQIMPESNWDQRALAYIGAFYGQQLRQGKPWHTIRKVIGLNILGGGKDSQVHWPDTPTQYIRHYRFQEQLHGETPPRFLEGIEIIQYSLANAPKSVDTQEQKDWLRFLKEAHNMTEEDVQREIQTPAVLEAFERAKLVGLPQAVKSSYDVEAAKFENLSEYIEAEKAKVKAEGRAEEKKEIAKAALKRGFATSDIQVITGLSEEEIKSLDSSNHL